MRQSARHGRTSEIIAVRVTTVAGLTVVLVPLYFVVVVVRVRLIVLVTINAAEGREVVGDHMALVALIAEFLMIAGCDWKPRMTELCVVPHDCAVTHGTVRRESARGMIRAGGGAVIALMAEVAVRRCSVVLSVHVTLRATGINVRAGQREIRVVMIE